MKIKKLYDKTKEKLGRKPYGLRVFLPSGKILTRFFPDKAARDKWQHEELFHVLRKLNIEVDEDELLVEKHRLRAALEEYIRSGEKRWAKDSVRSIRERLCGKMVGFLGDIPVEDITRADIIRFVESGASNTTREGFCSTAVSFLNWCGDEDHGRTWVEPRKFLKLRWYRIQGDRRKGSRPYLLPGEVHKILDASRYRYCFHVKGGPKGGNGRFILPEECDRCMRNARARVGARGVASHVNYTAALALAFFTGIRAYELGRMLWGSINFREKRIIVHASVAKTGKERVLRDLPPVLWEWLDLYRMPKSSPIIGSYGSYQQARRRIVRRAWVDYPPNGARHSFASYGYWRGEEWARRTMGHSQATRVFHRHYVDNGPGQAEADEYFSILP